MPDELQFFAYAHLPPHLQAVSRPFGELARVIVETLPANREREKALDKLLEAKDASVRALLAQKPCSTGAMRGGTVDCILPDGHEPPHVSRGR